MSEQRAIAGSTVEVTLERPGERIDKALADSLPSLSRAQCQRLISEGHVLIEGQPIKASRRLEGGEKVTVSFPEIKSSELVAEAMPLDIRYEDKDIILVNKPAGIVVHPAAGHQGGTLVNAILAHCPEVLAIGPQRRPGIVHRLDKDTSGLIVIAKNDVALRYLQKQFKERSVKKSYLALVEGHFDKQEALVDAPIGRDPRDRKKMAVIPKGSSAKARPAQTALVLLDHYGDYSLLECRPITGRTHQIRLHLSLAGYPIVGDRVYGRRKQSVPLNRHFLHASELVFRRPSDGQVITGRAELPEELQQLLDHIAA